MKGLAMTESKTDKRSLLLTMRCVFDVWFAAYPAWYSLLAFVQWTRVRDMYNRGTILTAWIELIAAAAGLATVLWCLWSLDKKMKGMAKAKWYVVVLLFPFGPTLCYFTRLRPKPVNEQLQADHSH